MKADYLLEDDWADEPEVIDFSKLIVGVFTYDELEDVLNKLFRIAASEYPIHAEWPNVFYVEKYDTRRRTFFHAWVTEDDEDYSGDAEFLMFLVRGEALTKRAGKLLNGHEAELAKWLNAKRIRPKYRF